MARIKIGNIKGPQGPIGPTGPQGPRGETGPQGPLPPLTNNGLATVAGVSALDAAYGKTLTEKDAELQKQIDTTNSNFSDLSNSLDTLTLVVKRILNTDGAPYLTDCNNASVGEIALFNPETLNIPTGEQFGAVLTFGQYSNPSYNYNWIYQFLVCNGAASKLYIRNKINTAAWTPWVEK